MRVGVIKLVVILRRAAIWTALVLVALFVISLGINARDEPLSSEAKRLLQLPANPYNPEQNIYLALAGFHAPPGKPVIATGQSKVARYNDLLDATLGDPVVAWQALKPTDQLALQFKGRLNLGSPRDPMFWEFAQSNGTQIERLIEQNRELYERYVALQALPGYFELERASPAMDVFAPPTELRSLFLAKFSFEMQAGDANRRQSALIALRRDMDLWRRMLTGEGNLISKMLAVAYLQTDYLVFSDMIADGKTPIPDDIATYLPEPDAADWNIGNVFASEFRFSSFVYKQRNVFFANGHMPADASASRLWRRVSKGFTNSVYSWFFQVSATENLNARFMNQLALLAAIAPDTFSAQLEHYDEWVSENTRLLRLRTLYNPIGKNFVSTGIPAYKDYPLRPYDAAALLRLVRLSLEIRQQQIERVGIPAFMKQHPEWSTHPADGSPFTWNPTTDELAVHPIAAQASDRRFSLQVWERAQSP